MAVLSCLKFFKNRYVAFDRAIFLRGQADEFHAKAPERSLEEIASSSSAMAPVVAVENPCSCLTAQATASKQANIAIQAQSEKVRQKRLMKELRDILKSTNVTVSVRRVWWHVHVSKCMITCMHINLLARLLSLHSLFINASFDFQGKYLSSRAFRGQFI